MVDFGKRLSKKGPERKIHPIEIYKDLDRSSEAGPLRPIQEEVLNDWFENYQKNKDVILKLHTGQGKTLVGLLILQSLLNQGKGPCLYVCPNIYLVKQTIEQARKFGLPFCVIAKDNDLPLDFLKSDKILICHVQKIFNGFTKFGLNNDSVLVGGIILDDSHACIDSIKDTFTIKITRDNSLYEDILKVFEDELRKQGIGTYSEIIENEQSAFLPIPYWAWMDNISQITSVLAKQRDDINLKFQWPLIKNILQECQCYLSGMYLEISPYLNPIQQFGTFNSAKHRVLMSATTMNDSFFIKGLNINKQAILNPLTARSELWSGEKMILIPYLINESLNRISIINQYANPNTSKNFGIVSLVPSFKQAKPYELQGCTISNAATIDVEIDKFKKELFEKPLVIVNRYDGIDLPDQTCRLLIIDSKPYSESLSDKYEEICREESNLTNIKIAQKIEQGLGRSVRGEKDYSVIILIGADLVNFIRNPKNQKYFSSQTKKQIEIGYEIAELASEDVDPQKTDMLRIVTDLIRQCITHRDVKWKRFYEERMNEVTLEHSNIDITEILEIEKRAEELNLTDQYKEANELIQGFINNKDLTKAEYGWYLQMMARFTYKRNKVESNQLQTNAFRKSKHLLKPRDGYIYSKINLVNASRAINIINWIKKYDAHESLTEKIIEIYSLLSFEETAPHFEEGLKQLGVAFGFESQRPDKENKEGPDNLWSLSENDYLLFECKNEVNDKRDEISKTETGQMNTSCGWFKNNYAGAVFKPIMVIDTKNISKQGAFNFDVEILRKNGLLKLKNKFKSFYEVLKAYDLNSLTEQLVHKHLTMYELDNESIKTKYAEKPYQR